MADVTSDHLEQRTMRMAFVEASLFFAGIPAGLLSGYLLQSLGFVSVFGLNIAINACTLLYVIFYLPKDGVGEEKLSASYEKFPDVTGGGDGGSSPDDSKCHVLPSTQPQSTSVTTKRNNDYEDIGSSSTATTTDGNNKEISCGQLFNPFSHLYHVFKVVTSPLCRKVVIPVILSFGFSVCAVYGELVVQTLYLTNQPFAFNPQTIGYYSAVQSGLRGVGVIVLTQLSYRVFYWSDYTLITVGIVSQILCYASIGVARTPLAIFVVNVAGVGIPVATTTLRSLATKNVSAENYGAVLASLEAMDALAGVLTNASTLWTYNLTLHIYSGIAYFALTGFALFSLLFLGVGFSLRAR